MNRGRFTCAKCQSRQYSSGEVRTTGGFWSKIFNIQNRKFITISCEKCGYTEFYNQKGSSTAENIGPLYKLKKFPKEKSVGVGMALGQVSG